MIRWFRRKWKQWRCKHSGKWYVPVYGYIGPSPWGYCCSCGKRRLVEVSEWKDGKITTDQKDLNFR